MQLPSLSSLRTSTWVPTFIRRWLIMSAARRKAREMRASAPLSTVIAFDEDLAAAMLRRRETAASAVRPPVAELSSVLHQRRDSRSKCRDLVIVETTLQQSRSIGEDQYAGLSEAVLSRAIEQLESLVDVRTNSGLSHLHFQMRRRRDALQLRRSIADRQRQRQRQEASDSGFAQTEPMQLQGPPLAASQRELLLMTLREGDEAAALRPDRPAGFEVIELFTPVADFVDTEVMPRNDPVDEFDEPSVGHIPPELLLQLEQPRRAA